MELILEVLKKISSIHWSRSFLFVWCSASYSVKNLIKCFKAIYLCDNNLFGNHYEIITEVALYLFVFEKSTYAQNCITYSITLKWYKRKHLKNVTLCTEQKRRSICDIASSRYINILIGKKIYGFFKDYVYLL